MAGREDVQDRREAGEMLDVVIVGAGFSGLYMLVKLRELGLRTCVFERGSDVGGTWFWNRYPGARCDVRSLEYSFSFDQQLQQEWNWTERFATQPEILRYLEHVAERFDLRRSITFDTEVAGARFDEKHSSWIIRTSRGEVLQARCLVMATGCLSASRLPQFEGMEDFKGEIHHTGNWPHTPVNFNGKQVGVIGTGSSGVQTIPVVAAQAEHLFVFQRTPTFTVPARNAPLTNEQTRLWKANYPELRRQAREERRSGWHFDPPLGAALDAAADVRESEYSRRWANGGPDFMYAFSDLGTSMKANDTAADFVRARIHETVQDPAVADLLTPRSFPIGTKRICIDTDYYATFNRSNVTLVDVRTAPIARLTANGLATIDREYPLDAIIFATGYDAMTGALTRLDLEGRAGARLADKWDAGPTNYLGIMTSGFPNMFMITGPGSPSVLSNVVVSIEQHVEWLADLFGYMRDNEIEAIEPTIEAEAEWVDYCRELADATLFMQADSWYLGANVPGKPRVFMPFVGGTDLYRRKCAEVAAENYTGFVSKRRDGTTVDAGLVPAFPQREAARLANLGTT